MKQGEVATASGKKEFLPGGMPHGEEAFFGDQGAGLSGFREMNQGSSADQPPPVEGMGGGTPGPLDRGNEVFPPLPSGEVHTLKAGDSVKEKFALPEVDAERGEAIGRKGKQALAPIPEIKVAEAVFDAYSGSACRG